jgi:LPXTG-motif cell wall-anchored protein
MSRGWRWLVLAMTVLALAAPAAAVAGNPAQSQYKLPPVSATGSGEGDHGKLDPPAGTGSGSSGTTIAILAGGLVAIGAAAGVIVYRRRRDRPSDTV